MIALHRFAIERVIKYFHDVLCCVVWVRRLLRSNSGKSETGNDKLGYINSIIDVVRRVSNSRRAFVGDHFTKCPTTDLGLRNLFD